MALIHDDVAPVIVHEVFSVFDDYFVRCQYDREGGKRVLDFLVGFSRLGIDFHDFVLVLFHFIIIIGIYDDDRFPRSTTTSRWS